MLIILAGLPGTGKTTLARALAQRTGAVHLRIDTIEQALVRAGVTPVVDHGYRVAVALTEDNLRLGRTVIGDSVNPIALTRTAWRAAAERAGVRWVDVEVVCSDRIEHRRRVETRKQQSGQAWQPGWAEVEARHYEPWDQAPLTIDTAGCDVEALVTELLQRCERQCQVLPVA